MQLSTNLHRHRRKVDRATHSNPPEQHDPHQRPMTAKVGYPTLRFLHTRRVGQDHASSNRDLGRNIPRLHLHPLDRIQRSRRDGKVTRRIEASTVDSISVDREIHVDPSGCTPKQGSLPYRKSCFASSRMPRILPTQVGVIWDACLKKLCGAVLFERNSARLV